MAEEAGKGAKVFTLLQFLWWRACVSHHEYARSSGLSLASKATPQFVPVIVVSQLIIMDEVQTRKCLESEATTCSLL